MLWSLAFDRLGVVVSDIYFLDPDPSPGQEGAERGVRLELRVFERDELRGSIYSAVPVRVDRPLWRVDLLESVDSEPGSLNRAHHHPKFRGWEPGRRVFVEELSADPVGWLAGRFDDPRGVLVDADVDPDEFSDDVGRLRDAGPEIVAKVGRLLDDVASGRAGLAPVEAADSARASWL